MTHRTLLRRATLLVILGAGAMLTGCFDDPDEVYEAPSVAEDSVPASATASPQAYVRFAAALPLDDRARPRHLEGFEAPTSETTEPEPVN